MLKEILIPLVSCAALGISLYNLYAQQFRRRSRLVGHLVSIAAEKGDFDRIAEYSIANVGDTQLLLKEVEVMGEHGAILKSKSSSVPCVLKPGDIVVVAVQYRQKDVDEAVQEEGSCGVEFGILSPRGIGYRLPHKFAGKHVNHEDQWGAFRLARKHEGF